MALPNPPVDACFTASVFESVEFSVDEFVSSCKKYVTTDHLHDDLKTYYTTLKSAMVELINKDYSDFLDLSANLVGMDKQIETLALPLSQLHEEIMVIKHTMAKVTVGLEDKMAAREEIRKQKMILKKTIDSVNSTELLEKLLIKGNTSHLTGEGGGELDRVAMEFNRLRHNMAVIDTAGGVPVVKGLTRRIENITTRLQAILEKMLADSINKRDHHLLRTTLETYSMICNVEAAEEKFREMVVAPALKEVISAKAILTNPHGLSGMYSEILRLIPKHCGFILEVSRDIPSFDILVNVVWAEIVYSIETRASVIFAPGNPDTFHKNFRSSMEFVDEIESKWCRSIEHVKKLRSHPSYLTFLNKWSLPVYYQIRFQEIGGKLEAQLERPLTDDNVDDVAPFSLEVFKTLYTCVCMCWADHVLLPPLIHRFWKLTFQLIVRFRAWLSNTFSHPEKVSLSHCIKIVHDVLTTNQEIPKIFKSTIQDKLQPVLGKEKTTTQEELLLRTTKGLLEIIPVIGQHIVTVISQQSIKNLDPVQTIPRLYRRTNREMPSKPSGYVQLVLRPLSQIEDCELLQVDQTMKWKREIIEIVTEKYNEVTTEVLENAKRTEDSLLKLKRNRKSVQVEQTTSGMSDDNKIRLQLAIDVEAYANEARKLLAPEEVSFSSFQKLVDMASLAKTTAFTIS